MTVLRRLGQAKSVWLIVSQAVGQLSLIAVIPVMTRVYSGVEVGWYQIGFALALVGQPLATLRLEFRIPVSSPEQVKFLSKRSFATSGLCIISVAIGGLVGGVVHGEMWVAVGLVTCALLAVNSLVAVENARLIALGERRALALRNLFGGLVTACLQVGVALLGGSVVAFAFAALLGRLLVIAAVRTKPRPANAGAIDQRASLHGPTIVRVVSSGILSNVVLQTLIFVVSVTLGVSSAALVGTAQRLAAAPLSLLGQGISQVIQTGIAPAIRDQTAVGIILRRLQRRLLVAGGVVFISLALAPPLLAGRLLGEDWSAVGTIMAVLALPVALQMVVGPMNPILIMLGYDGSVLLMQGLRLLVGTVVAALLAVLNGNLFTVVGGFAVVTVLAYGVNLFLLDRLVRRWDSGLSTL